MVSRVVACRTHTHVQTRVEVLRENPADRPAVCPSSHLDDAAQVTVGGQLQTLLLGPGLDVAELLAEDGAPVVAAEPRLRVGHQLVEEPHVDEVEELREELDGESGVDSTAPQQRHGARQRVQNVLWKHKGMFETAGITVCVWLRICECKGLRK